MLNFLKCTQEKQEMDIKFKEYYDRVIHIKNTMMMKMRTQKLRLKLIAQLWSEKVFEMQDRYKTKMKTNNSKKVKLFYNKLKGINTSVKEVMIERYFDQCKLRH